MKTKFKLVVVVLILTSFYIAVYHILAKKKKYKLQSISAKLLYVSDGDTIKILMNGKKERIRFAGIDAPEKKQRFGQEAKKYLQSLLSDNLIIKFKKRDRYRRIIAWVYSKGKNTNREMLKAGYAWFYRRYYHKKDFARVESSARMKKRGLWIQENPTPPWFYRKYRKPKFTLPEKFSARIAYIPRLNTLGILYKNKSFYLKLTNVSCKKSLNRKVQRKLFEKVVFKKVKVNLTKQHKKYTNKIFGEAKIKKFNLAEFLEDNSTCKMN